MSDKPGSGPAIDYQSFCHPHPLTQIAQHAIRCDVCKQSKSPTWRCVGCNYDECLDCFPRTRSQAASAPASGSGEVGTLWNLLNEARDSILPDQRGNPSPWSVPSSYPELFERLRSAEASVPSSAQAASFMSSRSSWTSDVGNSSNHNAAGFIRLLRAFEQGINGSSQGSWDRSGWISRCDAAAASGGGGGGSGAIGTCWNLLNQARDSILPDQRGNPSPWSVPSSWSELFDRLRSAEASVPSSAQSSSFMSNRSSWTSDLGNSSNHNPAGFIRLLKAFEVGINSSSQGSWDRSGWVSRCDQAATLSGGGGGGGDIGTLWTLLNQARDSILPDQRGSPSDWSYPTSMSALFDRLRSAEASVPSSAQSSSFMSSRSSWTSDLSNPSNQNAAGFIRLLRAFEQGINGSSQGSWDRSGWISRCDAAAAGGGGGGGGGSGDIGTLWNLLNTARDSINPESRGSPSNWSVPSSYSELFDRLRAAEAAVPSSVQSSDFMSNRASWTSDLGNSSNHNAAGFIRLLRAFEQGINGSAQGSWDRSGWISRCDAAASGGAAPIDYSSFCHPHPLVQTTHSSGIRCDVCKQQKNPTYRCAGCNYDECTECFPRTRSQAGQAGPDYQSFQHAHPLIRTDHSGSRMCDVCRNSASTTYYCSSCNYDECTACFPRTRSQAGTAPAPVVSDKDGGGAVASGGGDKGGSAPAPVAAFGGK